MRIISSYKDYYDCLNDLTDTYHIWKREITENIININDPIYKNINNKFIPFADICIIHNNKKIECAYGFTYESAFIETRLLIFCGKPYLCIIYETPYSNGIKSTFDLNEVKTHLKCYGFDIIKSSYFYKECFNKIEILYENPLLNIPKCIKDLNIIYKEPIIIVSINSIKDNWKFFNRFKKNKDIKFFISTNISLKTIGFQKILSVNECYQELENYIWNTLISDELPKINISDKLKAETHGFNKFSFRKDKNKI